MGSFDLSKQRLFGKLIRETGKLEPVVGPVPNSQHEALWYGGKTYLLLIEGQPFWQLFDPESQEVEGFCDRGTGEVRLRNAPPEWESLAADAPESGSPVHAPEVQQEHAGSSGVALTDLD